MDFPEKSALGKPMILPPLVDSRRADFGIWNFLFGGCWEGRIIFGDPEGASFGKSTSTSPV